MDALESVTHTAPRNAEDTAQPVLQERTLSSQLQTLNSPVSASLVRPA